MSTATEDVTLLVSGGEDIKYWTVSNIEQVGCKSFGVNINAICWSPNNLFLAAALESSGICIIGQKDNYETFTLPTNDEEYCVSVSDNSRYVLTGGKDKVVSIWDLKHRTIKKSFKEHLDVVHAACFNRNFTAMASGDGGGDIYIRNIVTDAAEGPFRTDSTQAIRGIQYSFFRKNLLASVSDDAVLNLWDTNTKQLAKAFANEHKAPTCDLSFSPVNDMLLASVGLDKRLVFYDVLGRKSVKTIFAESPLVSVEFYNDGATIATGSSSGKIYIFDLRSGSTPIRVTQAHKTSVRCMAFQRGGKPTDKNSSRKSSDSKISISKSKEQSTVPTSTPIVTVEAKVRPVQKGKATVVVSPQAVSKINGDIFSPIKDDSVKEASPSTPAKAKESSPKSTQKSQVVEITPIKAPERPELGRRGISDLSAYTKGSSHRNIERHDRLSSGSESATSDPPLSDVFSPFRKDSEDNVSPASSYTRPSGLSNSKGHFLPESRVRENRFDSRRPSAPADVISTVVHSPLSSNVILSDSPRSSVKPELTRKGIKDPRSHSVSSLLAEAGLKTALSVTKPKDISSDKPPSFSMPPKGAEATQSTPELTIPHEDRLVARTANSIEDVELSHTEDESGMVEPRPALHPFQVEYIRNMIEDAMEESRTSIHHDLVNLQIEVLRQLQIQQDEIKRIVEQYSINEDLVKENERLREEIKNLKTKYRHDLTVTCSS